MSKLMPSIVSVAPSGGGRRRRAIYRRLVLDGRVQERTAREELKIPPGYEAINNNRKTTSELKMRRSWRFGDGGLRWCSEVDLMAGVDVDLGNGLFLFSLRHAPNK